MHILASDFDGTIADTSLPSPEGRTVSTATESALVQIFGQTGPVLLDQIGGIQSRAPYELVLMLQEEARQKGVDLENAYRTAGELTDEFVRLKLEQLLPEISPEWPVVYPGFTEMYAGLEQHGARLAVVSSGHDDFIRRVFDVNDLPQPEILVTSDTLQRRGHPTRYKPDPYSLKVCVQEFFRLYGERPQSMMFIGDSEEKDGGLAREFHVPFGFFNPDFAFDTEIFNGSQRIDFRDFPHLTQIFDRNARQFTEGRGFYGMFMNGTVEGHMRSGQERR